MKTSYFARLKNIEHPISIAGKAPDFYTQQGLPEYKALAPKWHFFNEWKNGTHKGDNNYYIEHFKKEVLDNLDFEQVLKELQAFYPNVHLDEITLLCYEKPGDFCHRRLVADWLISHGVQIEEQIF